MSDNTKISWSDASWNPVSGCTEVSPGCANCYAKTFAERWRGVPGNYYENGFDVQLRPNMLERPLQWKKPRRIFVNSMSDLFHEDVPDEYIAACFAVMALSPQHTFQILTKRIERVLEWLAWMDSGDVEHCSIRTCGLALARAWQEKAAGLIAPLVRAEVAWPLKNVLIGPTIENQHFADVRLPVLAQLHDMGWRTMVSYEPALQAVNFEPWLANWYESNGQTYRGESVIDWLICGGESGAGRREFNHEWAYDALAKARDADVPFYMKQDGAFRSEVYDTLPDDLKVREFPS